MLSTFQYKQAFNLESGEQLPELEITYSTFGKLNKDASNVVWVCHALTANSNPFEWWPGLFGETDLYNPNDYFIVCANNLGSCYGTTGPASTNKYSGQPFFSYFPFVTIRDMVSAHNLLREHLGINKIHTIIGGSQGAQQILEWNICHPDLFENTILIATNAQHSPWGIAFNESQRMAIKADRTFYGNTIDGGIKGLAAARSIALLSYRNYLPYKSTQLEKDNSKLNEFNASSYQRYQGEKLVNRFNAYSYITLLNAMDSHNVLRGRTNLKDVLSKVKAQTLIIGISSDLLFPPPEQFELADGIKQSELKIIDSNYGHDGFLLETKQLTQLITNFYQSTKKHNLITKS